MMVSNSRVDLQNNRYLTCTKYFQTKLIHSGGWKVGGAHCRKREARIKMLVYLHA